MKSVTKNLNLGLFLLRLAVGGVFLYHGIDKLTHMAGIIGWFGSQGLPAWTAWLVAIVETAGGAFMILGLCTSTVAILFVIIMLVAIFKVKLGMPAGIKGAELDLVMLISSLTILFTGSGRWAICCGGKCEGKKGVTAPAIPTTPAAPTAHM